jgi:hypothetical protein
MLNELDVEMERLGLKFVRYADDFSIYCRTKSDALRANKLVVRFLIDKLKLPINTDKSSIRRPVHLQVLGFGFVPTYRKGEKGKYQLVVTEKKRRSLIRLGVPYGQAYAWSRTRMGGWAVAQRRSPHEFLIKQ